MKKVKRIGGFNVEILETVRGGQVWFTARIVDPYIIGSACLSSSEAQSSLAIKWEAVKTAYTKSNLAIPKPQRSEGNKRILNTLSELANRPATTTIL